MGPRVGVQKEQNRSIKRPTVREGVAQITRTISLGIRLQLASCAKGSSLDYPFWDFARFVFQLTTTIASVRYQMTITLRRIRSNTLLFFFPQKA